MNGTANGSERVASYGGRLTPCNAYPLTTVRGSVESTLNFEVVCD